MHYKNGREAKIGDLVVGKGYNISGVIVGRILTINPDNATCNCTVGVVWDAAQPIKVEYSQCDILYHAEDAFALSETFYRPNKPAKPEPKHEATDTNYPGYAQGIYDADRRMGL